MNIILHRVYDHDSIEPGSVRILVDRIWPRGIARATANWDVWLKEVAPSNELRKWFAHDREKWQEFQQRYFAELDAAGPASEAVGELKKLLAEMCIRDSICGVGAILTWFMHPERPFDGEADAKAA